MIYFLFSIICLLKSILFPKLIFVQMIGKHVSKSYIRNVFPVLTESSEMRGIFSFDHERLLNDKNIFGGLQKQNY